MNNLFNAEFTVSAPVMVGSVVLFGILLLAPMAGRFGNIDIAELTAFTAYLAGSWVAIRAARNALFARTVSLFLEKTGVVEDVASASVQARAVRFILLACGAALLMGGSGTAWSGGGIAYAEAVQTLGATMSSLPYLLSPFLELSVRLGLVMLVLGAIVLRGGWRSIRIARLNAM